MDDHITRDFILTPTLAELRSDLELSEAEVDAGFTIPMADVLAELKAEIAQMEGQCPAAAGRPVHHM